MAGTIATLLSSTKTIATAVGSRGPQRHAYKELKDLQAKGDPTLASPYLAADAVETVAANGGSTGNLTLTVNFPVQGVEVTTANIVYNAAEAAIQSAIDTAMSGATVLSAYSPGDIDAGACANMSANSCAITANGTSVAKTNMVITTANVDMDVAAPAVTRTTVGTGNRPAEAVLGLYGALVPASAPTGWGETPANGAYVVGDNDASLSPGLQDLLVREVEVSEDATVGRGIRAVNDCVG
jgi:hypothetical protein